MIALLLACTVKAPTLYPSPVPRVDLGPIPQAPQHDQPVIDAGDTAPVPALLVSPDDWVAIATRSRLLEASTDALRVCYDGRDLDRAYAQSFAEQQHIALLEQRAQARALRAGALGAFLLGGLAGAGVALGMAWGLPR